MIMDTCKPGAPTPLSESILCALNEVDMLAATLQSQALSIVGVIAVKSVPPDTKGQNPQPADFSTKALNKLDDIIFTLKATQDMLSRFI